MLTVGTFVGVEVGTAVGASVGAPVGALVGEPAGTGLEVGADVGAGVTMDTACVTVTPVQLREFVAGLAARLALKEAANPVLGSPLERKLLSALALCAEGSDWRVMVKSTVIARRATLLMVTALAWALAAVATVCLKTLCALVSNCWAVMPAIATAALRPKVGAGAGAGAGEVDVSSLLVAK